MAKWLAAGGVAILAILLLLWLQMTSDPVPAAHAVAAPAAPTQVAAVAAKPAAEKPAAAAAADEAAPEPEPKPGKLDPRSDEFFNKFDDVVPNRLTRNAAKCYEGRHGQLHRNQKLSLRFKTKIVNGEVTVHDVTIKESTMGILRWRPASSSQCSARPGRTTSYPTGSRMTSL